jgi:hypothetical protein
MDGLLASSDGAAAGELLPDLLDYPLLGGSNATVTRSDDDEMTSIP